MKILFASFTLLPRRTSDCVEWRDLRFATIFTPVLPRFVGVQGLRFATILLFFTLQLGAQDTFSIVAADSTSRQVGSAGASCVDLFNTGFSDDSFLGDLLPDTGAINSQAFYIPANQNNARTRMRAGDDPSQIISWLAKNDVQDNSSIRQYGIVGFTGSNVSAAGFTGANTNDYKNHVTGSIDGIYYSIQGNILLGQEILDSMESRFRAAQGDLACRLMAALQGAKVVGADTRCAPNGSSALFAFVKVAEPDDTYGNPSLKMSVRTRNNAGIEPVDSLQSIFDAHHTCGLTKTHQAKEKVTFQVQPNPATDNVTFIVDQARIGTTYKVFDMNGRELTNGIVTDIETQIDIQSYLPGIYLIEVGPGERQRFIKK